VDAKHAAICQASHMPVSCRHMIRWQRPATYLVRDVEIEIWSVRLVESLVNHKRLAPLCALDEHFLPWHP
jgi:hypothetical protein